MKQLLVLTLLILVNVTTYAQEKIKGSKNVTVEAREVAPFNRINIGSDIDVVLSQGNQLALEVEADDNLMPSISTVVKDSVLEINLINDITRAKALKVHVSVNTPVFILETNNKSNVTATSPLTFDEFYLLAQGKAQLELSVGAAYIDLKLYDKTETEMIISNNESTKVYTEGSSSINLGLKSKELRATIKDNTNLELSGEATNLELNATGKSHFGSKGLSVKTATVGVSERSETEINVSEQLIISAQNNAKITIYGNPSYDLTSFKDKATLYKK
ncbi:MAG: hypothetical protein CR968_01410 [Flavobacteriia bacterium]|nr:MAG: hypothetical protein CR968_01410 [Flavobacteriia bacterium]